MQKKKSRGVRSGGGQDGGERSYCENAKNKSRVCVGGGSGRGGGVKVDVTEELKLL